MIALTFRLIFQFHKHKDDRENKNFFELCN